MFNSSAKREAVERLEKAAKRYEASAKTTQDLAIALFELRQSTSQEIIVAVESYINYLANSPKAFDKSVSEFKVALSRFDHVVKEITAEADYANVASGSMAGIAVGTGTAVAAFGPTAAIAAATTFGTASTGTAISMLSGAAATNAALAWLGGGAIAAGGGGMVAGNALLALAGPVGWGIGAAALCGTALWANGKNKEVAEKANGEALKVEGQIRALETAQTEIRSLRDLTKSHAEGALKQLKWLRKHAPENYQEFSEEAKQELASLINNISSLSKLLNKQVA